jgi:hypothetical protein
MNEIEEYLFKLKELYDRGNETVKWDDLFEFERTYKLNYRLKEIKNRLKYLHKWRMNIGQEVYMSKKSFDYALVSEYESMDSLNKNVFETTKTYTFTELFFDRLCLDYIQYSIDFLLRDFLERDITRSSTHKLGNLAFEWVLECKQELIKEFKNAIK